MGMQTKPNMYLYLSLKPLGTYKFSSSSPVPIHPVTNFWRFPMIHSCILMILKPNYWAFAKLVSHIVKL